MQVCFWYKAYKPSDEPLNEKGAQIKTRLIRGKKKKLQFLFYFYL